MTKDYIKLPQTWLLGRHAEIDQQPGEWVEATVPGAVQLDWGKAHGLPEYIYSDNYLSYLGMEDSFWTYASALQFPELTPGQRLFFVCGGIDYRFDIGLGKTVLLQQEGMFTPVSLELTDLAKQGDVLWVRVHPAPKSFLPDPSIDEAEKLRMQANHSCKPAVSYGWDFHPRLIPLGIWQDAWLEVRSSVFLARSELDYILDEELKVAEITVDVAVDGPAAEYKGKWELRAADGGIVLGRNFALKEGMAEVHARLDAPQLWWPHDQGVPYLYTSIVQLLDAHGNVLEEKQQKVGFRRVRLVMNLDAWKEPAKYPKSRSHAPMTLEINGRKIFAKGSSWLSPEIFPGLLTRKRYEEQLAFAIQANMNILRCWGGAPVMKDAFFEICDALGIMIWQEFPLSCNDYPDDREYLRVLDQESRSIIGRLKHHPSVVIWCGGNELFNSWSGMDDQSLPLRLLDANCYQLDPQRPFLMTSPLDGAGHGPYGFVDQSTNCETWALFQDSAGKFTAFCEFTTGSGMRDVELLRNFIPEDELWPIGKNQAWAAHCAITRDGKPFHLSQSAIKKYFPRIDSLEDLVEGAQFLHSQGIRGVFEEVRRQKMFTSMALSWCFNEPWPNAAGHNLVTWYSTPLPALELVKQALRPVLASARIRKMQWKKGEKFNPECWILSDAPEITPGGVLEVWLEPGGGKEAVHLLDWRFADVPANTNLAGPSAGYALPEMDGDRFALCLKVRGRPELNSRYELLFVNESVAPA